MIDLEKGGSYVEKGDESTDLHECFYELLWVALVDHVLFHKAKLNSRDVVLVEAFLESAFETALQILVKELELLDIISHENCVLVVIMREFHVLDHSLIRNYQSGICLQIGKTFSCHLVIHSHLSPQF